MYAMHTTHVQFSNSVMAETTGDANSTEAIPQKCFLVQICGLYSSCNSCQHCEEINCHLITSCAITSNSIIPVYAIMLAYASMIEGIPIMLEIMQAQFANA